MTGRAPSERREFGGFARDAFLQGLSQGLGSLGYLIQIVILTRSLGLEAFGRYSIVVALVTLVQKFVDVRVEQATITFGIPALSKGDPHRLAGIVQFSYLVDLVTGVAGFIVVAALAPWLGPRLVGPDGAVLVLIFAVTLLSSTLDGSSGATLRLFDRYGWMLGYTSVREVARVVLVAVAVGSGSLRQVFLALLALDVVSGGLLVFIATRAFRFGTGERLTRLHLDRARGDRRGMVRMIFHTNVIGYSRLAQAQLPALVLAVFHTPLVVGVYKIGTTAGLALGRLTDPGLYVILPRLSRLWAQRRYGDLRRLVGQITLLSLPGMVLAGALMLLFRDEVLTLIGGASATTAGTVLVLAVLAQAIAGSFFWAGPLLIASGRSGLAARVHVVALAVQIPAAILLGRAFGAEGAAISLLSSYGLVVLSYTVLALRRIRRDAGLDRPVGEEPEPAPPILDPGTT